MVDLEFYRDKKVFITGHTGFKGTWLCKILSDAGAIVKGYALKPEKNSLFLKINMDKKINSAYGDIRNLENLKKEFDEFNPEIVIHLAAQPIVRKAYEMPVYTYETNVIGTVNILECVRKSEFVKSFLNVTTDKVYENNEKDYSYKEEDRLNGYDPYSNSKSCSELVTDTYKKSYFSDNKVRISTARAGNVIGGGDISKDRIIPDCVRAAKENRDIIIRNPNSIRPYQHVLEALFAYLMIAQKQYNDEKYIGNYNVGPNEEDIIRTEELVKMFCNRWGNIKYINQTDNGPFESNYLKLDCNKIKRIFNWNPSWNVEKAVEKIVEFEKCDKEKLEECMKKQIREYFNQ